MLSWNGLFSRGSSSFFFPTPNHRHRGRADGGGAPWECRSAAWEQLKTRHNTLKERNERFPHFKEEETTC